MSGESINPINQSASVAADDVATQKLNELREKAAKDFSQDEIDKFITMGRQLASKAVLSALVCVLREGPSKNLSANESKKLVKRVEKLMPYQYSGYVQCAFKEIPYLLNISLSLADRDYKVQTDIPHESYAKDLYSKYDFLKQIAIAYWKQFSEEQPELIKRIIEYRTDVDFSKLFIDPQNPTTMYFDPNCKKRISLFTYYVDQNGQPFYRKR